MRFFKRENLEARLFEAVMSGETGRARHWLRKGADTNAVNEQGTPALHAAVSARNGEMVELLTAGGADVDAGNRREETPLHLAADSGDRGIAELLIAKGARIDSRNGKGRTPLHLAALKHHAPMVEALAARGADVAARDRFGETPMQLARHKLANWDKSVSGAGQAFKDTAVLDAAGEGYVTISRILKRHGAKE